MVPIVAHTLVIVFCVVLYFRIIKIIGTKILFNHVLVGITFALTNIIPEISHILEAYHIMNSSSVRYVRYIQISYVIGPISGLLINIARVADVMLIKEIYYSIYLCNQMNVACSSIKSSASSTGTDMKSGLMSCSEGISYYYSDLYRDLTKQVTYNQSILDVLANLSLYFRYEIATDIQEILEDDISQEINIMTFELKSDDWDLFGDELYTSCKIYIDKFKKLSIREYAPRVFRDIRRTYNYTSNMFMHSFSPLANLEIINPRKSNPGGNSNSFIFTTIDERFVIKTVSAQERTSLISNLAEYHHYVTNNKYSYLVRILGIFKICRKNIYLILMENISPSKKSACVFDVKGSFYKRKTFTSDYSSPIPRGVTLKDIDLINFEVSLELNESDKQSLISQLRQDVAMLEGQKLMDYSLLICIYDAQVPTRTRYMVSSLDKVYAIAIVDYLQTFSLQKKTERELKKLVTSQTISSESADVYAERFLSFIESKIV
jgi:hypothetical protein